MTTSSFPNHAPSGRLTRGLSWTLRIFAAVAFLAAGGAKLAGVPMMVEVFDHIGLGQWFRIVTGVIEVIGAIALLLPATVAFSGAWLAAMMFVAAGVHLFVIGGSPIPAIVLMLVTATVAWLHRGHFATVLRTVRPS
ncbi:DoxX family protein [Xanthomonas sp. WHRI 7945]|nr:DoxX family protein [Xanthomonas campestris pv. campestris]